MKAFFRETLITIALAVAIFFLIQATVQTFIVVGSSMEPSFHDGQRLLVNKVVYKLSQPERGDVIVFEPPNGWRGDYIKRLIALPGDKVEISKGVVYVNGSKLDEPYIKAPPDYRMDETTVPGDKYFVLGDNRGNSNDSHNGWLVPAENIVGKVWIRLWPPTSWGPVPKYDLAGQLGAAGGG
ncbi:MAG: signal peptidase I [Chloroflexi bacterium]|nr:signal peptidase I [Chloroflexota bacterium]